MALLRFAIVLLACCGSLALAEEKPSLQIKPLANESYGVFRPGLEKPLLVFVAPKDGRPYVHPLLAPDGKGELTEYSPGHHKHQTGLYIGFTRINGRDYFHNRSSYWRGKGLTAQGRRPLATWTATYELLARTSSPSCWKRRSGSLLTTATITSSTWIGPAKLSWTLPGTSTITAAFSSRMPWQSKTGGRMNSEGKKNSNFEGQRARWVDAGMPISGRADWGHMQMIDHPANDGYPVIWRVDGQLGIGPAVSRGTGAWKTAKDETARRKYRLVIYTPADFDTAQVECAKELMK